MVQFLGLPKVQYLDSNGDPLSGGKLYTYDAGTTNNKASYPTIADAKAATNANANPVILDSRGEANVVLIGNTKLKLDTSADVNVWTVDNVDSDDTVLDDNGNAIVIFASSASAVNEITMTNEAASSGPTIEATGTDTNIDLNIKGKGSGNVVITNISAAGLTTATPLVIDGNSSNGAELRLAEDTDNGTNYIGFQCPATVASSIVFELPAVDGAATQILKTDGSNVLSWVDAEDVVIAASDTVAGKIEVAVQSEMETASSTTLAVAPGRMQYHPGMAKGWCAYNGTSTTALASYNLTSLTDNGTGDMTITWATDMSGTNYAVAVNSYNASPANAASLFISGVKTMAAGSTRVLTANVGDNATSAAYGDPTFNYIIVYGDQ